MCKELLPKVREADGMMCKWRELIPDEKMSEAVVAGLNFADMQMAAYTLQVQIPGEDLKRYGSQAALAHDVVTILAGLSHTEISSPWRASAEPQSESKGDEQASKVRPVLMRELNEDGSVKDCDVLLKELGFDVGVHVRHAADGEHGRIVSVEGRRVRLQQASGVSRVSVDGFLSGEWASYVPRAEAQTLPDLMLYAPSAFPEYKHAKVVANCWLDMCDLYEKFEGHELWQKLSIQLKPRKGIFAKSFIGKGKLTLCPTGLHLKHSINKPAEEPLFPLIMPDDDFHVWSVLVTILPKADDEPGCVNPCFLVQALSSEADCNMALIYARSNRCKGVKLPLLRNVVDLKEGDFLYMHKSKKDVVVEPLEASPPKKSRAAASESCSAEEACAQQGAVSIRT